MPLDPYVKQFLRLLASGRQNNPIELDVGERRSALEYLMKLGAPDIPGAQAQDRVLPTPARPLPVRIYAPLPLEGASASALLPGLIYFHGGGFVAGTVSTHDAIARSLATAGNCRVVSVEYRLAPEDPFPASLEDALAAVNYVAAHAESLEIIPDRIGICGDSAGGTLAAATCQSLARTGKLRLALQLLICPILDYSGSSASRRELASGYLVEQATLDHDLKHYVPKGTDPADPQISPLRADNVAGLPRTIIHTAEFDPMRDEGRAYFDRLVQAGSAVTYTCHPGMIHLFYGLGAVIPYASAAFDQIGGEIRGALA
jgi:acetyl esterase